MPRESFQKNRRTEPYTRTYSRGVFLLGYRRTATGFGEWETRSTRDAWVRVSIGAGCSDNIDTCMHIIITLSISQGTRHVRSPLGFYHNSFTISHPAPRSCAPCDLPTRSPSNLTFNIEIATSSGSPAPQK